MRSTGKSARPGRELRPFWGAEGIKLVPTPLGGLNAELRGDYAGVLEPTKNPGPKRTGVHLSLVAGTGFEPVTFGL